VRVTAPPALEVGVGQEASLYLPVQHCRVVIRS
jgi:hypothetical protein